MEETKNEIKNWDKEPPKKRFRNTKLAELQIKKNAVELIAKIATSLITTICLSMAFLFASLALGLYLSELIGSYSAGFISVAGVYLVLALVLNLFKKSINTKISNSIITELFKENDHE